MRFQIDDGKIIIECSARCYIDTLRHYASDNGAPAPDLPPQMASLLVDAAGRVVFFDSKQNAFPLPAGDPRAAFWAAAALAARNYLPTLLAAQAARRGT